MFQLLRAAARRGDHIYGEGVLEIMPDGYGFLRGPDSSYLAGPDDVYISPSQIRRFALRTGDSIAGRIRSPKDNERYFALLKVDTINYEAPEVSKKKVSFENLTPLFADERLSMERGNGTTEDITARVIDLVAPFGKGAARPDRFAAQSRQDDADAERCAVHRRQLSGRLSDRAADRRASGRSH